MLKAKERPVVDNPVRKYLCGELQADVSHWTLLEAFILPQTGCNQTDEVMTKM